jgi:hypothetical protein
MTKPADDTYTCPKCGSTDQFRIEVMTPASIDHRASYIDVQASDGSTPRLANRDWIMCDDCEHEGTVAEFKGNPQGREATIDASTMSTTLARLIASCEEALDGRWDRSDDGFSAMIDDAETARSLYAAAYSTRTGLVGALEAILTELHTDYTDSDERLISIRMIAEQELAKLDREGGAS